MKLLQVSDLHLERPFEGIYDEKNEFYTHLQYLNENVFADIIQVAIEKEVDLVLFCGDTFHQSQISLKTQHYFLKGMEALNQAGIQVVMTFGNHDYYTPTKFWFDFPENVFLFTSEEVTEKEFFIPKTKETLKIVAFSYENRWITENKLAKFPKKDRGFTVGIYHGSEKTGDETKDRYAPFVLSDMRRLLYDYVALGHIHVPQVVSFEPPIIYGGTPQGHSRKETKGKGVVLVELKEHHPVTYEFIPVESLTYETAFLSLVGVDANQYLAWMEDFLQQKISKAYQILALTLEIPQEVEVDEKDLLYYLRKLCKQKNWPIYVNELIIENHQSQKIPLPLSQKVLNSYQQLYHSTAFFKDEFSELNQIPELYDIIQEEEFQQEVLKNATGALLENLQFEEDQHAAD